MLLSNISLHLPETFSLNVFSFQKVASSLE